VPGLLLGFFFGGNSILIFKVALASVAHRPQTVYKRSFPRNTHPHLHLLLFVFMMIAILTGVEWNLAVVLICISQMTKDVDHFFTCLLVLLVFNSLNCLYILDNIVSFEGNTNLNHNTIPYSY
jgi:hypothetical protein